MIELSRLSTEYVRVQVSATVNGSVFNPTADVVQMAFIHGPGQPQTADWNTALWETAAGAYYAIILVGPSGGLVLAPGLWNCWVRVVDSPEVPVRSPAQLAIT